MATQTLTFAYSQAALFAVNGGVFYPAPVAGSAYATIQVDFDVDSVPDHDTCVFKREVPNPDPAGVFLEFELVKNGTAVTSIFGLRRGSIVAYRCYMSAI